MRRILVLLAAFLASTGAVLVLPVYAAPVPTPVPVKTSSEDVPMGSVSQPAPDADVQSGTSTPVSGVAPATPTLTVRKIDTEQFSLVGVTWKYDPAITDTVVQVRVRNGSGPWGKWTQMTPSDGGVAPPESSSQARTGKELRAGTEPLWTGPNTSVEAQLVTRSGAQPTDVKLDLVDPGKSAADRALPAPAIHDQAHAAMTMPAVYSRAQWGADESQMTWDPEYAPTIKAATLHHTVDSNNYTADQVPAMLRSIYHYHAVTLGWGDIGYNVIVDKFGRIWEGRAGGLASTVIGGHAYGFNTGTFGVSMLGNYDTTDTPPALVNAVSAIIAWKFSLYGVDPSGSVTLVSAGGNKYAAGTAVTLPTIFGHRDVYLTDCPGQYAYARLPQIRAQAAALLGNQPYVTALYQDMMGRSPDPAGLAGWTTGLSTGGMSRRTVVRGFSNSTEYRTLVITQAYRQVLGREPDPAGLASWLRAVADGAIRLDNLRTIFMATPEFYLRSGSSDAAFVTNIYQAALGRSAAQPEIDYWAAVRRTSGPGAVISAVWGSPEAGMIRVNQLYQYYLGRSAAPSEQRGWLPVVVASGDEQLREEITISQEYFGRAAARFPAA